jgi:hypothetical protein
VEDGAYFMAIYSTTSRAFSASPIAFCVLGIIVCLVRLVGDVSSFGPEPLIRVQAPWDQSEDSGPSLPGRRVDIVNHSNSCACGWFIRFPRLPQYSSR